jgi:hypothetical protein
MNLAPFLRHHETPPLKPLVQPSGQPIRCTPTELEPPIVEVCAFAGISQPEGICGKCFRLGLGPRRECYEPALRF